MITFIQTILNKSATSTMGRAGSYFRAFPLVGGNTTQIAQEKKQIFSRPWDSGEFSIIKDWKPFFINLKRGNPELVPSKNSRFADPCQSLLIFARPAWGNYFWLGSGVSLGGQTEILLDLERCFKRPTERDLEVSLVDLHQGKSRWHSYHVLV